MATRVTILSMKRIYALMAIGLLLTINARGEQTISPEWLFVQTPLWWKPPPAEAGVEIRGTAAATVLVLYPNGKYAAVECLRLIHAHRCNSPEYNRRNSKETRTSILAPRADSYHLAIAVGYCDGPIFLLDEKGPAEIS